MNLLKGFMLAFNMLTIIPLFKVHNFFKGINAYAAIFYPLVGFIVGYILFGVHFLLDDLLPAPHLSVIIFSLWIVVTGALHLDGYSDTVDALFVSKDRAVEVMKDSHVGGMGMIFTIVFLLLKLSSLIYFEAYYLLPVILMLSRLNATLAIYFYNYISSGVTTLIKEELTRKHVFITFVYVLVLTYSFSFLFAMVISILTLLLIAKFFTARLGGLSGDIYGFTIEVTELLLLNYSILTSHVS